MYVYIYIYIYIHIYDPTSEQTRQLHDGSASAMHGTSRQTQAVPPLRTSAARTNHKAICVYSIFAQGKKEEPDIWECDPSRFSFSGVISPPYKGRFPTPVRTSFRPWGLKNRPWVGTGFMGTWLSGYLVLQGNIHLRTAQFQHLLKLPANKRLGTP